MRSRIFQTPEGEATLRCLSATDEPVALEPARGASRWAAWRGDQRQSQVRIFPEGQLGVEVAGRLVATSAAHVVHLGREQLRPHTRAGVTEDGYFYNHDLGGDTLYVSELRVPEQWRRRGIGEQLLRAQIELCRRSNLQRLVLAVPVAAARDGGVEDGGQGCADLPNPTAAEFLSNRGFVEATELRGYARNDERPLDATLFAWANPDYRAPLTDSNWVRVALVQHMMRGVDDFAAFARQVEYFVQAARGYDADFVLFPEFTSLQLLSSAALRDQPATVAIGNLSYLTKEVFGLFSRLAQRHHLHIIGGSHPVPFIQDGQRRLHNVCPIAMPDGRVLMQPKLHITPSETEAWGLHGGAHLAVIPTPKAKIGVLICYDSEFPEAARCLADQGVDIIFVPYCTDDRQGHLRVRWCCQARAVENQIYVAAAGLVGNLPGAAGLDVHYGRAAVFTPSDFTFARDGIQAEADPNVETLLVTDLDLSILHRVRERGSVRPRRDRRPDLFELVTHLESGLPEYEFDSAPLD